MMYLVKNKLTNHIKTKIGKWQVVHSPGRNFIWFKNAKTAGTSMYRGVMVDEIDDLITYKEHPEEFDLWWESLTDKKINDCFKFIFVRNPLDRAISAFSHIILEDVLALHWEAWPLIHYKGEAYPMHGKGLLNFDQVYMMFSLFIKRVLQTYDLNEDSVHWMPQSILAECDGELYVDFVGRYENLEDDWKYVANKLKISEELPFIPASSTQRIKSGTREELQKLHWTRYYIGSKLLDIVLKFYKRDLDIFGYGEEMESKDDKFVISKDKRLYD